MMESNLVAEFVSKTGATSLEAHNQLQARGWDLKLAIQEYLNEGREFSNANRPVLAKSDSLDLDCRKLNRGISRATDNACVVSRARCELGLDFRENGINNIDQYFNETPVYTFTLPDFSIHPDDFREFLERDVIDISCLNSLEQAGRLNWWVDSGICQRLWPLSTTGDGNCLLHAASLGMWGFHDRLLILRRALHEFLTCSEYREALWRRWRWQLTRLNAEAGLVYTEDEWEKEWEVIVSMASSTPRNTGRRRSMLLEKPLKDVPENATYESLEEIHVLALAHVLKRTIIIIADTMLKDVNGENLAPILFGGIYLPLEIPPAKCHKSPLVLTYDSAHFCALVVMDSVANADKSPQPPAVIPLTDSDYKLLPVQFAVDPGEKFLWGHDEKDPGINDRLQPTNKEIMNLLRLYLDITLLPLTSSPSSEEYDELDTPGDEEDIEKRFYEVDPTEYGDDHYGDTSAIFGGNKSKAARQLQTVARSFGSIGKSMSRKLKNLGTITKITRGNEKKDRGFVGRDQVIKSDYLITARLASDTRPGYQDEMVKNYLNTARTRFERENKGKLRAEENNINISNEKSFQDKKDSPKRCVSDGCNLYGSPNMSYMCSACFERHRQQEMSNKINSPILSRHTPSQSYNYGKSRFYVEPTVAGSGGHEPLQVSKSTFYPRDWSANRVTLPSFPQNDVPLRRTMIQDVGNAIDGLGPGRYTPQHRATTKPDEFSSWDHENGPHRKIHSYNLSRETAATPPKTEGGTIYCVKGTAMRSQNNPLLTGMSPQSSQDLPEIDSVFPIRSSVHSDRDVAEKGVTRIIPIAVESSAAGKKGPPRRCLNVTCHFYGSPELENYCSKCFKGRHESWAPTYSAH